MLCVLDRQTVRGSEKYTSGVWVKRYLVPVDFYICKLVICQYNEADIADLRKQNSVLFLRPEENEQVVNGQYEYHRQPKCTVQHNTLISYHTGLHVSVRTIRHQALLITTI